jgi:thiopurine S-methyltransferase
MEPDFWHERWAKGEIGFHQHDYNRHMQVFIDSLAIRPGGHILVPLCGKSRDMLWLLEQGYSVTGIELSPLAVEDFFAENGLTSHITDLPDACLYTSKHLSIYCGDYFTVDLSHIPHIDAVYDRASLIAMSAEKRPAYVDRLSRLIPVGTRSLLVTLDYPQDEMSGPPFSVSTAEVKSLYSPRYSIEQVHSEDCLAEQPRFRDKGLTRLDEHVFVLQKLS